MLISHNAKGASSHGNSGIIGGNTGVLWSLSFVRYSPVKMVLKFP